MPQPLPQSVKRAAELRHLLNKAAHAYYVLDSPFMEDAVYDNLYRELLNIESKHPELKTADSPSQRLGGQPAKKFINSKHRIPLLSLDNAFNIEEFKDWHSRVNKLVETDLNIKFSNSKWQMVGELKIDGNALALSYSKGILVKAATRGNGSEGEEITPNVRTINSIPLCLNLKKPPPWLEIRGEAFIPNKQFRTINEGRIIKGENEFANPRNACAGTLRQLDPEIVASRNLDFFAYSISLPETWQSEIKDFLAPKNQLEALAWLKKAGFKVNPNTELLKDLEDVKIFSSKWESERQRLPYATDGLVIKVNDFVLQQKAGCTHKAPRWAIALKYPAEEAPSKLIKLTCQVGRTGTITPIAEFKPVSLAGTSVSRATLHNANRLSSLDLHEGDTIVVRKAGEIIPEVVRVLKELRASKAKRLDLPESCPECKGKLVQVANEAATRCINSSCPAILRGALRHWASKGALDIEGLGSKLIEQLVDRGLVESIASLYGLDISLLASLERMGTKSAEKLLEALAISKQQPWHRQLYGLGINHIGESNAKLLAKTFSNITDLETAACQSPNLIKSIFGIGKEVLESLEQWFLNPKNQKLILELQSVGFSLAVTNLQTHKKDAKRSRPLTGNTFVLTGTLPSLSRSEAVKLIEERGGEIKMAVSASTTYLLAGEKAGSKLTKAEALGIQIINEQQLKKLLAV